MWLFCSLIELAQSFFKLSNEHLNTGSLSIYRSFLEHYVDLVNLRNDESYVLIMELADAKSRLKQLEQAQAGNIYFKSIKSYANDGIPKIKIEISELQDKLNKKMFHISEKFEMAGMINEYNGIYNLLCSDTHSSVSSLFNRHFRESEDKTSISLVVNDQHKLSSDIFYYANMAQYLTHAGSMLCQILDSPLKVEFDESLHKIQEAANNSHNKAFKTDS